MRRRRLIAPFLVDQYSPAQWYQSYAVSRDDRSGRWTLYERRDDCDGQGGATTTERYETAGDVVDVIVGALTEYGAGAPGFVDGLELPTIEETDPAVFKALIWALTDRLVGFGDGQSDAEDVVAGWLRDQEDLLVAAHGHTFRLVRSSDDKRVWDIEALSDGAWQQVGQYFASATDARTAAETYAKAVAAPGAARPVEPWLRARLVGNDPLGVLHFESWTAVRADLQPYIVLPHVHPDGTPVKFVRDVDVGAMRVRIAAGTQGVIDRGFSPGIKTASVRLDGRTWGDLPLLLGETLATTAEIVDNKNPPRIWDLPADCIEILD